MNITFVTFFCKSFFFLKGSQIARWYLIQNRTIAQGEMHREQSGINMVMSFNQVYVLL